MFACLPFKHFIFYNLDVISNDKNKRSCTFSVEILLQNRNLSLKNTDIRQPEVFV